MKRFAFSLVALALCLWLAGCSGKTEKTDAKSNAKTKTADDSAKRQGQPNARSNPEATKQIRGFARSIGQGLGRGVDEAARATPGGSDQNGGPGGVVSEAKVVKDLEKSKRLGAFMRAVGVSSGQEQPSDAPPEPKP